jgi:hypothetical protein
MFDKFFDCLNVSQLSAHMKTKNVYKAPYRSGTDFRLKWLKEDFLGYLDKWEEYVNSLEKSPMEKKMMMLPVETRTGLRITGTFNACFMLS